MIEVAFKNLEQSEFTKSITLERAQTIIDRFPDLQQHKMKITLSMENSPRQAGPDVFKVRFLVLGKKYSKIILEKAGSTFYLALADAVNHMLERLNRYGDKKRVKQRNRNRKLLDPFKTARIAI